MNRARDISRKTNDREAHHQDTSDWKKHVGKFY